MGVSVDGGVVAGAGADTTTTTTAATGTATATGTGTGTGGGTVGTGTGTGGGTVGGVLSNDDSSATASYLADQRKASLTYHALRVMRRYDIQCAHNKSY